MERVKRIITQIAATPSADLRSLPLLHRSLLPILSLASSLYASSLALRRRLYLSGILPQHRLPVPVISVGNVTWGGTGKTPMTEFVARIMDQAAIRPLILSRGYAGGDEVKMLQRHLIQTSARIGIGANRSATAASLFDTYGCIESRNRSYFEKVSCPYKFETGSKNGKFGVVVLDDGMQVPNTQLKRLESIVQKIGVNLPIFRSRLCPSYLFEVKNQHFRLPLSVVQNMVILCVSAIGCPDAFVQDVEKIGPLHVDRLDFSDHYCLQVNDIVRIRDRLGELEAKFHVKACVMVTEKDYDRDPFVLKELQEVLVLCSSFEIMPFKDRTEENFRTELKKLLIDRCVNEA